MDGIAGSGDAVASQQIAENRMAAGTLPARLSAALLSQAEKALTIDCMRIICVSWHGLVPLLVRQGKNRPKRLLFGDCSVQLQQWIKDSLATRGLNTGGRTIFQNETNMSC